MSVIGARLLITGRVQGVGFRAWTSREARRRHLRGWVRNRHDGSVEALLIGEQDAIGEMIERCRHGPSLARVDEVTWEAAPDDGTVGFAEQPTV